MTLDPATGAKVARAAAWLEAGGPAVAVEQLPAINLDRVADYQPYWVVLAEALTRMGATADADVAARQAVRLTTDDAVKDYLGHGFHVAKRHE